VKGPNIHIQPLTRKPEHQRFTISGVLTAISIIIIIIIIKKVKILGSMEQLAAAHCPTERTLDPQYAAQQTHLCSSQLYYGFHPTMFSGSDFAIFMLSRWL